MEDLIYKIAEQGIAPAIVVAIYLIITKILDSKKEDKQIKINAEIVKSVNILCEFVNSITKNIFEKDKEKCKIAIESSMSVASYNLTRFFVDTIVNNHIDVNKENVLSNIDNIVTSEYYNTFHSLSLYVINGNAISNLLKTEWMQGIKDDMINILYNPNLSKDDKILSFNNRIDIKFQSFTTYIINNGLK